MQSWGLQFSIAPQNSIVTQMCHLVSIMFIDQDCLMPFSCLFCGYVVMYFILQMQWVRYRSHRFRPSHSHRQTYWLTTQNQGLGTTIRTLLLHQSFTWICYVMINIVCTCFLFIFRSPVIESRNDPSKIDETTIEPPRNVSKITVLWFRNPKRDFITPHPQMYKQE